MDAKLQRYTPQRTVNLDWLRSLSPAELRSWLWELLDGHDFGWLGRRDMTPEILLQETYTECPDTEKEVLRNALAECVRDLEQGRGPNWSESGLIELMLSVGAICANDVAKALRRMVDSGRWLGDDGKPTEVYARTLQALADLDPDQGFEFWRKQALLDPRLCFGPALSALALSRSGGVGVALILARDPVLGEWGDELSSTLGFVLALAVCRLGPDFVTALCRQVAESDSTPPALRETLRGWFADK